MTFTLRSLHEAGLALFLILVVASAEAAGQAKPAAQKAASKPAQTHTAPATKLSHEVISRPWTGDFDGMVKRR